MKYLRLILLPISLVIDLLTLLCSGAIYCTSFVFRLCSNVIALLGCIVLLTGEVKNGCVLLFIAWLISPMGIPMLIVTLLGLLQRISGVIKAL